MKKISYSFPSKLSLLMVILFSCNTELPRLFESGNLTFSWKRIERQGGRVAEANEPKSILVTIRRADGTVVEDKKKIRLYTFGAELISETMALSPGEYSIEEFFVLDEDDNIIFATPTRQSSLAAHVEHPLPIEFVVTEAGNTLLELEVIAPEDGEGPESFGYLSFSFKVVEIPSQARLKELWIEEESGARHKVCFTYSNGLLVQSQIFSLWSAADAGWTPNGTTTFLYDNDGKLITKSFVDPNAAPHLSNTLVYNYTYDSDKLVRVSRSGYGYGDTEIEFSYDEYGHVSTAVCDGFPNAEYEYDVNSSGDIVEQRRYVAIESSRTIQYKVEFTYHESLKDKSLALEGLFDFDIFAHGVTFSKHNVSSHKTTAYHRNTPEGPPVITFSCSNLISYEQTARGLVTKAKYYDSDFCVNHVYENNTEFTFIYE